MKNSAPLSASQYGIYAECVSHQGEVFYNLPYIYILDGSLDGERLRKAVETAVKAHPALFARISLDADGNPVQTVAEENWTCEVESVRDIEALKPSLVEPFELYGGRLFRIQLLRDATHFYLFTDLHHLVADGTSMQLLLADIDKAYAGEPLEEEKVTMLDVASDEAEARQGESFGKAKDWYAAHFDCSEVSSPLLPDLEIPGCSEGSLLRTLSADPARISAFCKDAGIFRSTLFTAAYSFLLAKYNNEKESYYTTVYNGRSDKSLSRTVGMFVKTLPVYAKFEADTPVLDFLRAGEEQMKGCREHDSYAYSDLVRDLGLQAESVFVWHGTLFSGDSLGGKPMEIVRLGNSTLDVPLYLKAFLRGGRIQVKAEYNANRYSSALIASFLESYEAVLDGFLSEQYLKDIPLVTPAQLQVLDGFNATGMPYDRTQTIVSLFRAQAAAVPANVAVVYKDRSYTYAEVDELSDRIAAYVASLGLGRGDVVSVLIPRCEWMAIASLGILKAGCAYQPLDPTYPAERLNFMMQDAGAGLLIADGELRPIVGDYQGPVMLTSDIPSLPAAEPLPSEPGPEDMFILLYTSGSTGTPKGCRLTHANLAAFCAWYWRYYDLKPEHRVAAYASYGFDACMMDLYPALTRGASVHIIPEEIRLDLVSLNAYFEKKGITHAFMTTQVAYQFATCIENHSLLHLSTGGEKLASLAPPDGYTLHNGYGPTECTIFTTTFRVEEHLKDIPIGKPLDNLKLYVVDPDGKRLPVGASGELWISGPQVSLGYLNRPEKTAEVFIDNPFEKDADYSRIYRSGDVVRYLPDGNIQFVGRKDMQVKIRGFRIELKEVESVIREFPGIKDVTVQAFDQEGGGKFLAAYVVSSEPVDVEALNQFILERKPPYMVPAVTMQIDAIPLNQNQKVNKRALPKPERKAAPVVESNAPMNVLEQQLHDLISEVIRSEEFGITTPLSSAGVDSLSAIRLAVLISKRFGVELDSRTLLKEGSLQTIENEILHHLLEAPSEAPAAAASAGEEAVSAPLSHAQTGVYFECLKNPASTLYNIPYLLTWPSGTDAATLAAAVKKVAESHSALHFHFTNEGDSVVQTLADRIPVEVLVTEMNQAALDEYKHAFVRPFNLQRPPLYRFEVVKTETGVHLLMDVHHLVFDGGSADLFIREVCAALEGKDPSGESYSYLRFVSDQIKAQEGEAFESARAFFAEKLGGCEGASEIPQDLPKSAEAGSIGEAVCKPDFDKASRLCREWGITPAHLFLSAVAYVVSRYTNNRDVYLCTVSSGRSNLKTADTVGMFVNTLALGMNIGEGSVREFLQQTAGIFDETLRHEDYPFARIAADYGFQPAIAYAYQVGVLSEYKVGGETVSQELLELKVPKFKINIKIESRGVVVQYDDAAYSPDLGRALAESIVAVTERMMAQPEAKLRSLSIISQAQEEALSAIRQVATGEAPFRLFHECIGHFAAEQPARPALIATDASFTYKEMEEATNRIAQALRKKGVREGDRVALLLPRTSRLILSLFGVLKAGAAYIPCDPDYPEERVKLILEDSGAKFTITPELAEELLREPDCSAPAVSLTGDDLAYLIYTSGSTGRPKGVMLRHEGICNYLYGHPANVFAHGVLTDAERILSVTTISFDAALQDIGMAFFNGKTLILATEEQANNPLVLSELIAGQHIDMVSGTPSRWQTWLTSDAFCKAIALVKICRAGGEKFSDALLEKMRGITRARIFNCYGPTETTVACNNKELTDAQLVTVGKPQLNVKEYILDADGNELPVGVVGELVIGGRGVARGYNNLEEKTRESFITFGGERVYRSGDYAKWLPDGDVVILGRTDHQIKLRGLRIELGEIENVMLKVEGVKKVVILIRKLGGKEHLCAYYTADREIAPDALKAEISKSLTQYMVPTAYLQLEAMPLTPNGKTDVKALPDPVLAVSAAYEAPANDTERAFCDIFAGILQLDRVGARDSFFELGGTSLVVMQVIVEAEKAGLHVTYGDVFANPTPRQLACLVTGDTVAPEGADDAASYDYGEIDALLQANTLDTFRAGGRRPLGDVLLTGATGYLGIHILRELIDSDAGKIYCLVRAKTQEKAESRLKTLLFYYFSHSFAELIGSRILVIRGDVTSDFGKDVKADTLINCAAVVKHFSEGTDIEDINVGGARSCVEYCLKSGARLIQISTASTRGVWVGEAREDIFTEKRLYMGQFLGNQYIHSKFIAERIILEAVARDGLDAKIMRVGNLAARSTDGEFQANFSTNSFMGRIKVYNMLGCCPYAVRSKKVEFSPINEVSRAIVLLACAPRECTVFHPYNPHTQFLGDVLSKLTTVGDGIRFVEQEDFDAALEFAKADPQKARVLASLLAYRDDRKSVDVVRDNEYTTQALYRLGFEFSPTSWDYVERMLSVIGGFGFFE